MDTANQITSIPLDQIIADFGNDRTVFDADALAELADSIRANGLAQPITVRPVNGRFQLIAGERRYRAHLLLNAATIRAIVTPMDDETAAAVMLAENTARKDIDPIDEANAFKRRMTEYGWSIEHTAKQAGKRADYVTRRLALLNLRDDLQFMVRKGQLAITYGEILANAGLDKNRQMIALKQFNASSVKSDGILTEICAKLREQQDQTDMFGLMEVDPGVQTKQVYEWKAPPQPAKDFTPPVHAATPKAHAEACIAFWNDAAEQWDRLSCKREARLCTAAADSLRSILPFMPDHSTATIAKRGKLTNGREVVAYLVN